MNQEQEIKLKRLRTILLDNTKRPSEREAARKAIFNIIETEELH